MSLYMDGDGDVWFTEGHKAALWEQGEWLSTVEAKHGPLRKYDPKTGEYKVIDTKGDTDA